MFTGVTQEMMLLYANVGWEGLYQADTNTTLTQKNRELSQGTCWSGDHRQCAPVGDLVFQGSRGTASILQS